MNKRIKELLLKVVPMEGEDGDLLPSLHTQEDIEKFAELIVRECAKFSYAYTSNEYNVYEWDEMGRDCLPNDLQNAIKEHFGVE